MKICEWVGFYCRAGTGCGFILDDYCFNYHVRQIFVVLSFTFKK